MDHDGGLGICEETGINEGQLHTVTLHDLEELDNDLGARSDHDLTLAALLGVVDRVEGIVENGSADHLGGVVETEILKSSLEMRYLPMVETNPVSLPWS